MPRLLLVDDNPSIHRIAESLLAPTDVALVCVASAAEALAQLERGESFDVALVDTAMPGMDGWTLVSRLRASEATATLPIALMAGVLDPVDPVRLASAPVQGFLKKPIELRELGDRVKALMAIPVPPPAPSPSPFSTVPATPARELLQRAEAALPEFRPEPEADAQPEVEADLLVLTAEDVWVEEPVVDLGDLPEVQLELEELDLGSLPVAVSQAAPVEPLPEPSAPLAMDAALPSLPDLEDLDLGALPGEALDLGEADRAVREEAEERPGTDAPQEDLFADLPPLSLVEPALDQMEPALDQMGPALDQMEPTWGLDEPAPPPAPEAAEPVLDAPESAPVAAEGQVAAVSGQAHPGDGGTDAQARAVVQALLADPVLVDALVKAVVARMGDQILREIAWEVFPDLAGKLRS
jgi:CheY-like chemotaxis protein